MTSRRNTLLTAISLALVLLVAACTPANTAPSVTILNPTDGATVFVADVVLSATATDAQDGDLVAAIVWVSNVDGDLTPAGDGSVELTLGTHVITASATDSAGQVGTDSVTIEVVEPQATHVIAEGLNLRLVKVEDGSLVEADSASLPSVGLLPQHAIFNVVKHPSEPWLYAASMNDCGIGDSACWGNARIDRFVVENDSIRHDGAAFLYDLEEVDISCAQEPAHEDYVGQVGYCALNGMVFSPDGTRFYVDEDNNDIVQIFSVAANGDLAFLSEGASTDGHGLAIDATGTYLYNGDQVIEVTGDVATEVYNGNSGNATALVDLDGLPGLVSTFGTSGVAVYDLTDPVAPALIDHLDLTSNQARDLDFTTSAGGIVVVGRDNVRTVSFDGATLTTIDTYTASEALTTEYRGVALTADINAAIAAWFQVELDDTFSGGAHLFSISGDGELTLVDALEFDGRATTVLRFR